MEHSKKPIYKRAWFWFVVIFLVWGFVASRVDESAMGAMTAILILSLAIVLFIAVRSARKNRDLQQGIDARFRGQHITGLPIQQNQIVNLILKGDTLSISSRKFDAQIRVDQIKIATSMSQHELATQQKSVAGRAVAGGVLLGPVGAIVGGMSGIGTKNKKGNFLVLNYTNSSGELASIVLNSQLPMVSRKFADKLNANANIGVVSL